jgi:8-oxo-dGTP pyrophosphatase MutT (NUDIX family)
MAKKISCGVVVLNEHGWLLLCHATETEHWDIPKGLGEAGERPLDTALREMQEETGLAPQPGRLKDLGVVPYRSDKDLHLFTVRMSSAEVNIDECTCHSMFPSYRTGRMIPEMDAFRWVEADAVGDYASGSLARLFANRVSLAALHAEL